MASKGKNAVDKTWIDKARAVKAEMCLIGLTRTKCGIRRSFSKEAKAQTAAQFDASASAVFARKQILNPKRAAFRAVTRVLSQAHAAWQAATYPWMEDGFRMIAKASVEVVSAELDTLAATLAEKVDALVLELPAMIDEARENLGELFDIRDYPTAEDLRASFTVEHKFASLEAAEFLREISPALADAEEARIAAQVQMAVAETEAGFYEELQETVGHLIERLTPDDDGKSKSIQKRNLDAFAKLFDRFGKMNLPGDRVEQVRGLMDQARNALQGVDIDGLKGDEGAARRSLLRAAMSGVRAAIDANVVERPSRKFTAAAADDQGEDVAA